MTKPAEHGRLESRLASSLAEADSPFERDVIIELTRRGVAVVPQVGVAGYRIDIGVLDDELPGRFVCGIECDGLAYHSSETARDRDRLRQQVLEQRGWTLLRVWSTDWFKDRAGQIERLTSAIGAARTKGLEEARADREADKRSVTSENTAGSGMRPSSIPVSLQSDSPDATHAFTSSSPPAPAYQRPSATPYNFAPGEGRFAGSDILAASDQTLETAIQTVVDTESPIHMTDLMSRVAGMWSNRAGSRIQSRILAVASTLVARDRLKRRNDFFWSKTEICLVRSRAGSGIPVDRIAPEELEQAILSILANGHSFPRPQLTNEVRAMLGYARTGAIIEEAVTEVVARLLATGRLGEGSAGLAVRFVK